MFKKQILKSLSSSKLARKVAIGIAGETGGLPGVFIRTPSCELREQLMLPIDCSATNLNQDIFALLVNKFQSGYFVEVGANDGFCLSNTLYLENCFGWKGLLIEPNPKHAESLHKRKATVANIAACANEEKLEFHDQGLFSYTHPLSSSKTQHTIIVQGMPLNKILKEAKVPSLIDYISIDVEGNDLEILREIIASPEYRVKCGTVEHNYNNSICAEMKSLLEASNYKIVWESETKQDLFFVCNKLINISFA